MPLPFCSEQFHVYLSRKELGGIDAVKHEIWEEKKVSCNARIKVHLKTTVIKLTVTTIDVPNLIFNEVVVTTKLWTGRTDC